MGIKVKRRIAQALIAKGCSIRLAARAVDMSRESIREKPKRKDSEERILKGEMKDLAREHKRFGYRMITGMMRQSGHLINHKRLYRWWREEGLQIPRKRPRKRTWWPMQERPHLATKPNEVWCYDFIFDRTEYGDKLKILNVEDEFTREILVMRVERKMNSEEVTDTLSEIVKERGAPKYIRSDNGSEFIAERTRDWLKSQGIKPVYIEPGCPWENGYIESMHSRFRDECLNQELFWSRGEAQVITDQWRKFYNEKRPHSSLGYRPPAEKARFSMASSSATLRQTPWRDNPNKGPRLTF